MTNRKINFLLLIIILTLVTLACNSTLPQTAPTQSVVSTLELLQPQQGQNNLPLTEADVPRVPVEDAKSALDSGEAIIVDVRNADAYAQGHVTGAISIPLSDIENDIANVPLDKDQWIITYCTWQNEHTSARAAFLMLHNGFTHVTPILGGLSAWVDAGYPTEK